MRLRSRSRKLGASLLIVLLGFGCAVGFVEIFGRIPLYTYKNEPLPSISYNAPDPYARLSYSDGFAADQNANEANSAFVGVALSGGGSRAAVFAAAVLKELDDIGFLARLNAISSVSGGSLAAAYYALFRNTPTWEWKRFRDAMATNFFVRWVGKLLLPHNWLLTTFTDLDRSDLMASVLDDSLFRGATYAQLAKTSGPKLLINATAVSNSARPLFVFSTERFSLINSNLATYPIAHAVMASGAFPGAFNDVTLRDFMLGDNPNKHDNYPAHRILKEPRFEHLIDGGPVDNLGLVTLLQAAREFAKNRVWNDRPYSGCYLFVVDAATSAEAQSLQTERDARRWYDLLIDTNVIAATDALLAVQRKDALRRIDSHRLRQSNLSLFEAVVVPPDQSRDPAVMKRRQTLLDAQCSIWHLTFDSLDVWSFGDTEFVRDIRRMVGATRTHYKLTGPEGCSPEVIQQSLYDAASMLVWETNDGFDLSRACSEFNDMGLSPKLCETIRAGNLTRNATSKKSALKIEPKVGDVEGWESVAPHCP